MDRPTPFPDLDALLAELVTGIGSVLGDRLVGVYLQGSFALGAGDVHSDVDFLAVTETPLTDAELDSLQVLHARLHGLPGRWATHLEGSYLPRADVRARGAVAKAYPYLDNGASE